ncbi:hypothetical protein AAX30_01935 [Arcobacter porcinus]|nr:hypothetical protein AAX30_01935 [Arcobacter porcinus]
MVDHRANANHTYGSYEVTPVNVEVIANDYTKTYDGIAFNGGAGVHYQVEGKVASGLYGNDILGGTLVYGGSSQGQKDVGSGEYIITPSGLSSTIGNYNISFVDGKLKINPAELHVRADDASKTYDGKVYDKLQEHAIYSGFVGNEDLSTSGISGDLTYTYTKNGDTGHPNYGVNCEDKGGCINAGTYDISLGGLSSNGNYLIVYDDAQLTIKKANLTISADDKIFQYVTVGGYDG